MNREIKKVDLKEREKKCSECHKSKLDTDDEFQGSDICYDCFCKMGEESNG